MKGFCMIGLERPKRDCNVGGVLRAAHVFGASGVVVAGMRFRREPTDTTKAWRHIPVIETVGVLDAIPYDCQPIAVELVDDAKPIETFRHPERAFYIFGPEDGSVSKATLAKCVASVVIPSRYCLNLAAAVNVVLYDRVAKGARAAA